MKRWDVVAAALAAIAAVAAGFLLVVTSRILPDRVVETLVGILAATPAVVLGAVVARRRPGNVVGPLLTLVGTAPLVDMALAAWSDTAGSSTPLVGGTVVGALAEGSWMLSYAGPLALALLFPTGRLLAPAWRWAPAAVVIVPPAFVIVQAFAPAELLEPVTILLLMILLAVLVASVVAVVVRYRRGDEDLRRQLRWLAVSASIAPVALLVCFVEWLIRGTTDLVGPMLALLIVALPVSVAVAMLRHRLYGYDRLLSGTVRWALLVASLGLIVTAVALGLGLVLGGGSPLVAAVATLVAALLFRPLQQSIRRGIDARFQPRRERALRAVRAFVIDVRDGRADPDDLAAVLRDAIGPGLEVRVGPEVGVLVAHDSARLTAADVRDISTEAGLPLELSRLRGDLRTALRETEQSRARLVRAADDERRRIQRDLHDGAQSNLVALGIQLRNLGRNAPAAGRDIGEAVELVQRTLVDLRSLAQGVRPSSLDEGLEAAMRAMARSLPLPTELTIEPGAVPEPLATAVYYVAAEAVTNALKHAHATRLTITLRHDDGLLLIVEDDGDGAADPAGSGIAGVRDRVEAAGGRFTVSSPVGVGTRIDAAFP